MSKLVSCVVAMAFMLASGNANGQTSQHYQLNIDPNTVLTCLSADQFQTHPSVEGNLDFFDSEWYMESNSSAGASVTFSAGPFINEDNPAYMRDSQMRLRRLRNRGAATWAFEDQVERTRYSNGKMNAVVKMSCTSAGRAFVGMRVRFFTETNPTARLPAGNYVTTVVGTISAN